MQKKQKTLMPWKKILFCLCLLSASLCPPLAHANQMRSLYQSAFQAYHQKKFGLSIQLFERLLPMLKAKQKQHPPRSQPHHMLSIGTCDILYHIAQSHWQLQQKQQSCRQHHTIDTIIRSLPTQWTHWNMNPTIQQRLKSSQTHLHTQCQRLPIIVFLRGNIERIKLSLKTHNTWRHIPTQLTIQGLRAQVHSLQPTLKIEAEGYTPLLLLATPLIRWKSNVLKFKLLKAPLAKAPPPRPLLPQRPLPQRPPPMTSPRSQLLTWILLGTGVVVVGGTVAAVILTLNAENRETLQGRDQKAGFVLWNAR